MRIALTMTSMLVSSSPTTAPDTQQLLQLAPQEQQGQREQPLQERHAQQQQLLQQLASYGVVLVVRGANGHERAWRDIVDVADLIAGLESLPEPMRRFPGGPLEVEVDGRPMPFGMGDGSAAARDWSDGRRRFHLYRYADVDAAVEPRALYRIERLTFAQRRSLWRRRAIVHAVLQRWDDAEHFSDHDEFRGLNGWLRPFERALTWRAEPLNVYPWAYSRQRGMSSPSLDLVTFAEELFVPAEQLDEAAALSLDDRVVCQELSKLRFLREQLAARALLDEDQPLTRPTCPAFDRWAQPETLEGFEVLLVAASGRSPESMFGHLMLRPVRSTDRGGVVAGPSTEQVVQLVAFTGNDQPGPQYIVRGVFGGYRMALMTTSAGEVGHQMLENQQRTIRRFRLQLTRREETRALERIWELERRGYWAYKFFSDNCGTAVINFLNSIIDGSDKIELPPRLVPVLPTAALDFVAAVEVRRDDGTAGPLLVAVPDVWPSTRELATSAFARRDRTAAVLLRTLPAAMRPVFRLMHERASTASPAERAVAYAALDELAGRSTGEVVDEALLERWRAYFTESLDIERYAVDRADSARMKVQIASLLEKAPLRSPDDDVSGRQRQFEREEPLQRAQAVFDRMALVKRHLQHAAKRPLTDDERSVIRRADQTERSFDAVADALGRATDRSPAPVDAWRELDERKRARAQAMQERLARSLPRSGYARFELQAGALVSPATAAAAAAAPSTAAALGSAPSAATLHAAPVLTIRSAALAEDLGDHRVTGFQPSTEVHALAGQLVLVPSLTGLPHVQAADFTLAGFRTLLREPPTERESATDSLGWSFRLGHDHRSSRAHPERALVHGDALAILDVGSEYERFTVVGLGGAAQLRFARDDVAALVGPRLSLAHRTHLFGSYANAVRLEAAYLPAFDVSLQRPRWTHELNAALIVDVIVGPLRAGPRAQLEWEQREGARPAAPSLITTLGLEWVQ